MSANSIKAQLAIAAQKVRLFGDIIFWMLTDLWQNAKQLSFSIIGFSIASVFTRLGIIGILMIFVKAQTEDKPIIIRGYEIPSDTSFATLALWGGCVLIFATATGIFSYTAEALAFRLSRRAMARATDKALTVIAAGQTHSLSLWANGEMKSISRKAMIGDSMMLMRAMLVLGGIAVPLITLCIAAIALFWLDTKLTLFLMPVIAIYAIPFYLLNRGIATASLEYEKRRLVRSREIHKILDFASQTQYPGNLRPVWADYLKADPSTEAAIDSFRVIILSRRKMAMLQDILYGVILCVLLIVFGSFLLADKITWLPLLWYLLALRYAMTGMNGTASLVIALNRFAPQIKRLKQFITFEIPDGSEEVVSQPTKPLCIQAIEPKLDGSMNSASPQAGEIIACIGAANVNSYYVRDFCEKLLGNSKQSRSMIKDLVYCGDVKVIPQLRICELATGKSDPDSSTIKSAESALNRLGVLSEIQNLPKGMDTVFSESVAENISAACRYAICLASALSSSRKYIILDWRPLSRIQEAGRKKILDALADRVVVLVFINGQGYQVSNATLVVVMDETAVRGIGDLHWYKRLASSDSPKGGNDVLAGVAGDSFEDDLLDDL